MAFNPNSGGGISSASDVALSNPQNNHALSYDTTTGKWKNLDSAVTHSHGIAAVSGLTTALNDKFTSIPGAKVLVAQDFTSASTVRCTGRTDVSVRWRGPVEPINMIVGDEWYVTTP